MPALAEVPDSATIVNYFDSPEAARRYAAHRPRGQARVLAMLQSVIDGALPVARALDVGCGTGNSTIALLPYAKDIVGLDPSSSMLAEAPRHPQIEYRKGYAEALPFRGADFDLVTVSSAYHWFDHERFLGEVARVLRPGGWLVLYKAGSTGNVTNSTAFETWRRDVFHVRYPKVARNSEALTPERAARHGFAGCAHEIRSYPMRHALDPYVDNLLTHSSVLHAIDYRLEPVPAVRAWLRAELKPFFPKNVAEFAHECRIHVLRRLER
jgi:ubiquinone/menaquinone biosynthesis C-methylase UbiE